MGSKAANAEAVKAEVKSEVTASEVAVTAIDKALFDSVLASRGKRGRKATDWGKLISEMKPGVPVQFQTGLKSNTNSHPNVTKLNMAARALKLNPGSAFGPGVDVVFGFQRETGSLVGCLTAKVEAEADPVEA